MILDKSIKDNLNASVMVALLPTKDKIVGIATKHGDGFITFNFTYQVNADNCLVKFLPEANDRRLDIPLQNLVVLKRCNSEITDKLFQEIFSTEVDQFTTFLKQFAEYILMVNAPKDYSEYLH